MTLHRAIGIAKLLVNVAAGSAAIATFLGFTGVFQLLDYPRPQYCLILLCAISVGGISRKRWSLIWCLPLAVNLIPIVPLFFPPAPASYPKETISQSLRIIHANLDRYNQNTTPAIEYIEAQDADLIFFQEVTSKWLTELRSHLSRYQIATSVPLENSQGVAMLVPVTPSKSIQVVATQIIHLPSYSKRPLIETTIRWGGKEVGILSLSLARPTNPFQEVELKAAAEWSLRQQGEVIVIGDFNLTPWSRRFRRFLANSNLRNSLQGFGLQPTWPAHWSFLMMVAIDHCLHSPSLTTINRATGPNLGSDHLPLFVELHRGIVQKN